MKKVMKAVISLGFVVYLFALVVLLFLGARGVIWTDLTLIEYIESSSNFVPFKTISTYFKAFSDGSMNMDIPIKNLAGNFIMFLPMGLYLPYFIRRMNNGGVYTISMTLLLVVIELTQVVTRRGGFDIDDFILNMFGALLGFGIWKLAFVRKLLRKS